MGFVHKGVDPGFWRSLHKAHCAQSRRIHKERFIEGVFGWSPHYRVLSVTAAELCAFPIAGFARFAEINPRPGIEIARLAYSAAPLADRRLTALGRRSADARTAALFVELHDRLTDRRMTDGQ